MWTLKHLSFTLSHSYWFLSTFSLLTGKMSYETQIPLLKGDVRHVLWYWGFDNSIIVATAPHVFWQDWWPHDQNSAQWWQDHVIPDWWIHLFALQSWLQQKMHSRALLCSRVWTLSSLLVWQSQINTQSKSFSPSADLLLLGASPGKKLRNRDYLASTENKTWL